MMTRNAQETSGRIEKLADLAFYTEGPAVDSKGNIYCTTLTAGLVLRWSGGKVWEWARLDAPNGQVILPDDTHLICTAHGIEQLDAKGKCIVKKLGNRCAGETITTYNDLYADQAGNVFFTDSVRHSGKVGVRRSGGEEEILARALDFPNGIVMTADAKHLLVAESYRNRILQIAIDNSASSEDRVSVFATLPVNPSGAEIGNLPDGLALDEAGNLWVAHYGMAALHILSPHGILLKTIDTGLPLTSNVAIGGPAAAIFTGGYGEPGPGGLFSYHRG